MSLRTCSTLRNLRLGQFGSYGGSMLAQQSVRTFRSSMTRPTDGVFSRINGDARSNTIHRGLEREGKKLKRSPGAVVKHESDPRYFAEGNVRELSSSSMFPLERNSCLAN